MKKISQPSQDWDGYDHRQQHISVDQLGQDWRVGYVATALWNVDRLNHTLYLRVLETDFLLGNPSRKDVLDYHVSAETQARLQRLLTLNEAGLLGEIEQAELDELERLEHIIILLKAQSAS